MKNPIQPTNNTARDLAQSLLCNARFAALAVVLSDGSPLVTRIAFGQSASGQALTLVSELAMHTRALQDNPVCSVLIGEPGNKGDPLSHPRLSLQATATFVPHHSGLFKDMAAHYLRDHPKAKLYLGLTDFSFVLFNVNTGHLNAGFGKAFTLNPADMGLTG
ncbi:MAG: pyridoxamine 5'-phosphate oxidase family protein [Rhodobacteraceae bacterium]|nr:pyridoxamine 5'-phosphate oxidase family protein [Paracoccaceae bacterium]